MTRDGLGVSCVGTAIKWDSTLSVALSVIITFPWYILQLLLLFNSVDIRVPVSFVGLLWKLTFSGPLTQVCITTDHVLQFCFIHISYEHLWMVLTCAWNPWPPWDSFHCLDFLTLVHLSSLLGSTKKSSFFSAKSFLGFSVTLLLMP